uniref:Uncharacterized protein n=1 Tax=Anguilla anguilla TaxID=7936 RepID=A0A0E9X6X0_ANGAN
MNATFPRGCCKHYVLDCDFAQAVIVAFFSFLFLWPPFPHSPYSMFFFFIA